MVISGRIMCMLNFFLKMLTIIYYFKVARIFRVARREI